MAVQQLNPLESLLFTNAYLPTLKDAQRLAPTPWSRPAMMFPYAQGDPDSVVAAVDAVLSQHARKCAKTIVYCTHPENARHVATQLQDTADRLRACGTSLDNTALIDT